ncbi:GntR family transcriptional regulator [Pseudorhodoferax sp.]|uniref:GntR family transcriptional regulator n=1 Tax=Pseudorhodoferax sp. TaxID=1993553 RepID=UPI0039E566BC
MTVATLVPRALYEEVAEALRQRIYSRELPPGSWIDEVRLAEHYGISRTPLREALKVLAAEGLVTMKVRRGAYVTEVSETDLNEVFHLLGLLEADAAADAARLATPAQLAELEALHAELEAAEGNEAFFAVNVRFHARLQSIAGNRRREAMVGDLRRLMQLVRISSLHKSGRIAESRQEHRDIMDALRRRDPEAARARMQAHVRHGRDAAA